RRPGDRVRHRGGARRPAGRPHHPRHRPPALDHPPRRPHRGALARASRRGGNPCGAPGRRRDLRPPRGHRRPLLTATQPAGPAPALVTPPASKSARPRRRAPGPRLAGAVRVMRRLVPLLAFLVWITADVSAARAETKGPTPQVTRPPAAA